MSSAGATLLPIFATPFGAVQLDVAPSLNAELQQLFRDRTTAAYHDAHSEINPLCFRSRDDLLDWPEQPVQELKRQMLSGVAAIVEATNLYTAAQFGELGVQARGWFTLVHPDGGIPVATYPQTSWCAIYCVTAPELSPARPDAGLLRLYESRLSSAFIDASTWRLRPPFSQGHHTWQPVAGSMAVFPAAMPHEIAMLRSSGSLLLVTARVRFATPSQTSMPAW
jgi:hypothetical protein